MNIQRIAKLYGPIEGRLVISYALKVPVTRVAYTRNKTRRKDSPQSGIICRPKRICGRKRDLRNWQGPEREKLPLGACYSRRSRRRIFWTPMRYRLSVAQR